MKGSQVILGMLDRVRFAAKMVDGQFDDLLIEDLHVLPVGSILRAVVDRPVKGIGGAFLRLPSGNGFLRKASGLTSGQAVLVQVTSCAEDGKAIPLTNRILFKSRYCIVTPDVPGLNISRAIKSEDRRDSLTGLAKTGMNGTDMGLIIRSAAAVADDEAVLDDIAAMRHLAQQVGADTSTKPEVLVEGDDPHTLAWREWSEISNVVTDPAAIEASGILESILSAGNASVPLSTGMMYIEPTRALVAVDVNTGADISPAAPLKANLAAVQDLPRQLRLRGLGGQITIDMAPMTKRDRKPLESALRAALRKCPVATEFIGWTPLGHVELKRKRERVPLGQSVLQAVSAK